ncbi:ABC transporter substrate-binding protein [Rhodococcus erythropolis]|uniref:ABC transporter substrate-binding protein n=1 Tax=Rhodococcus erythropolis TaxID=1833 RepID=UPI001BEA4E07|nr:ABC transporter substrate-binding protein [Rhodococcus erythropolis]MBT2265359.1 ABC transporter substrate-binding protein [Rhodococcus erythropolis]
MKHRSYPTLAAAAGLTLVLSACGSGGTSSGSGGGEPATDGTFRFAMQADPGALNPIMAASSATGEMSKLAYDYLIYQDPDTSEIKPWLAEKWEETPTSASFTIRDGVTCTDGSTLTPQTVADNINFVANPDNGSQLRGQTVPTGATATADPATRVVTVTTPAPSPFLLLNVGARLAIMCDAGLKDPTASNKQSLGTGMFELTEVVPNDHYTFERREGYNWGPDGTTSDTPGVPKTVVATMAPNVSTAANQLLSGELNAAPIGGPDKDRVDAANLDSVLRPNPAGQMYFNQIASNPTSDPAVRKALIQAVNLDDLTQVITAGRGVRATSLVGVEPRACVYDSVAGNIPDFDLTAAKATLDAAGWTAGADGKRSKDGKPLNLRLVYDGTDDPRNAAAELAQSAWSELGATVEVTGGDSNKIIDVILSGKDNSAWDIAWVQINTPLPSTFAAYFAGPIPAAGKNFASISNPAYEAAATKASGLTGDAACDAWAEAESEITKSFSAVPFADSVMNVYFNKAGLAFGKSYTGSALRLYQ